MNKADLEKELEAAKADRMDLSERVRSAESKLNDLRERYRRRDKALQKLEAIIGSQIHEKYTALNPDPQIGPIDSVIDSPEGRLWRHMDDIVIHGLRDGSPW